MDSRGKESYRTKVHPVIGRGMLRHGQKGRKTAISNGWDWMKKNIGRRINELKASKEPMNHYPSILFLLSKTIHQTIHIDARPTEEWKNWTTIICPPLFFSTRYLVQNVSSWFSLHKGNKLLYHISMWIHLSQLSTLVSFDWYSNILKEQKHQLVETSE